MSVYSHADDIFSNKKTPLAIPEIGEGIGFIDRQNEKLIGEKVYRQINQQLPIINNPWLEDQFMAVFSNILSQTELGQPIGLLLVRDPQINAFAVPGGVFALNTGMITSAKNMDEVAGVMSHEIAHVTQRHYSRSQEAFKGQGLLALAGILVGAALAAKADGNAGGALMMGTQAALMDRQLNYSRNQEREADRIGMQMMYAAGYNPQSMADFFETMNRSRSQISFMPDFWLTHPLTTERMSESRLRANQYPRTSLKSDALSFEIIKWYTLVLTNQVGLTEINALLASQNSTVGSVALAAYYLQRGDYVEAQHALDRAKTKLPNYPLINLLQADLYLGQNQPDSALKTIVTYQKIAPENRAYSFKLAEIYIRLNQPADVQRLVERFTQKNPRDIAAWQLMQQAATLDRQNPVHTINVLRYRAEAEYWSGEEESAIKSLLHAQRLAKDNLSLKAKIDARLKTMKAEWQLKL